MCAERNNDKNGKTISCGWCDGITEMIKGCFPDDAGYSACLARMNEYRDGFCGRKADTAAKRENQGCCG